MFTKRSKLQISLTLLLAAYLTFGPVVMLAQAQGSSSGPSGADYDPPTSLVYNLLNLLQTLPFDLFEVDVATLGISDNDPELMNAGINGYDSPDPNDDRNDASVSSSDPKMFIVDDDKVQCPNAQYQTIQEAVDAAGLDGNTNDRDKIKVCPGRYVEQVKIEGPQYNNLRLFGRNSVDTKSPTAPPNPAKEAIIEAPPTMAGALARDRSIVLISDNAQHVLLRHFFITGPSNNIWAGVFVAGGASATIRHNHITKIETNPAGLTGEGHGVAVGRRLEGEVGSACVRHNLIDTYQKTGVFVDHLGTSAEVRHNEIIGRGSVADIAQNGVQISRNARAEVRHNKISQNLFEPCSSCVQDFDAIGILTMDENNTACAGTCDSIGAVNPNLLNVHHNKVFLNEVGIGLGRSTIRGLFDHNRPESNTQIGLRAYGATRNGGNTAPEAQENTISYNKMENNPLDCSDQTTGSGSPPPSANYWKKNKGDTEDTPGICKK